MPLEHLLTLRGVELARAFLREVLRVDCEPPPPDPGYETRDTYSARWAWHARERVRRRYDWYSRHFACGPLARFECYTALVSGDNVPRRHGLLMYFEREEPVEFWTDGWDNADPCLLAGFEFYRRLVMAGLVEPRGVTSV